jgi:hypothetical protein
MVPDLGSELMASTFMHWIGLGVAAAALTASSCAESPHSPLGGGSGGATAPTASGGTIGSGPPTQGASGGTSVSATGGASASGGATGSGGSSTGSGGGSAPGTGGAAGNGGAAASGAAGAGAGGTPLAAGGSPGGVQVSPDLIASTHADGYLQLFPANPIVAIGPWFTYDWGTSDCNIAPKSGAEVKKGAGGICFSGQSCTGAAPGAGLGFKICTTPGDISTWTEMQTFMAAHGMTGTNAPYGFGQCNTGNKITAINWVGQVPSGAVIDLHDATDVSLVTLPVTAGATSVAVPATVDGGKIASIHFSMNGTKVPTWNFCVSMVTLSYQ